MAPGWYVYKTAFHVPRMLAGGGAPKGVIINGQLASDNGTFTIYMESPSGSSNCTLVSGQNFPVTSQMDFGTWTRFGFENSTPLAAGEPANLYFVVQNQPCPSGCGGPGYNSASGFRAEFFKSSTFF